MQYWLKFVKQLIQLYILIRRVCLIRVKQLSSFVFADEQEDEVTADRDNPSHNASEEGANGRSADVSFYSDSSTESEMSVCSMEM